MGWRAPVWDRLFCGFARGIFPGTLAFNQDNAPDAGFIEEHHRPRQDNLRDDIWRGKKGGKGEDDPVSYTHLTLPTIYSV